MNERIKVGDVYFELAKDVPARPVQVAAEKATTPVPLDVVAFASWEPDLVAQYIERKIPVAGQHVDDEADRKAEWQAFTGAKSTIPQQWRHHADGKQRHCGFNMWAFVFGFQWFLFHRLYGKAAVIGCLEIALAILASKLIANFGQPVLVFAALFIGTSLPRVIAACWANLALYQKANREIGHARSLKLDTPRKLAVIADAGAAAVFPIIVLYGVIFAARIILT